MLHTETRKSPDTTVKMKSGSAFTVPASWQAKDHKNYIEVAASENDVSIYFLELPATDNLEKITTEAWKQIHPHFDLKLAQELSPSATDSWEKMYQIVYAVPTSESRFVMAIVRIFKDKAYLCLVDGTLAGISRRGAELTFMVESWKPVGFKETQLNYNEAKVWTEADAQAFEKFVSDSMQKLKIPGASIAIVSRDGKSIYKKAFGIKQLGSEDLVTVDTPFMIGSITKPLTTMLMATLVDQKKLSWDTPVTKILPDFCVADAELTKKLTIRHTVSASTGMPRGGYECIFKYKGIKPEDRLLEMKEIKPTTKIGETFQYSNYLVMAGGYAAARACIPEGDLENAYAVAMKRFVFDPLQMRKTVIKPEDALMLGAALPHGLDFNGQIGRIPLDIERFAYGLAPAGAVWSTVGDMSKYLLAEMNNGVLGDKRIMSEESIMERRKPGIRVGEKSSYGLCLMVSNEQGLDMVGHGGGTMGFSSDLFFLPEKGIGMVVLTNASFVHYFLYAVKQKFMELTFSAKPCSEETVAAMLQEREKSVKRNHDLISLDPVDTKWIENVLGEFSSDRLGFAKLRRTADGKGYEMEFEEWKSRVGSEVEKNGKKILVLIDPPSYCGTKLLVEDSGNKLVFDGGQERHDFIRVQLAKKKKSALQ